MRKPRSAYTLLEVLVAMAISVLLLSAVYSVIGYQVGLAKAGRDMIEKAALARAILNKIDSDVVSTLSLGDPARFRRPQPKGVPADTSGMATGSGMTGGTAATGGMTGGAAAGMTGGAAAGMTDASASTMTTETETTAAQTVVTLPLGVLGGEGVLHLFASKFPNEVFGEGEVTCDMRRISYWLDPEKGLCRSESRLVTSEDGASTNLPSEDLDQYVVAPEVKSFEVEFFDGSAWSTSWDSNEFGPDSKTPIGSPRAVKVRIGLPKKVGSEELKYHTHIVLVPTAGNSPPATAPETAEEASTANPSK